MSKENIHHGTNCRLCESNNLKVVIPLEKIPLTEKYINKNLDSIRQVLFEKHENGFLYGLSDNYIRVHVLGNEKLVNKIMNVKLVKYDELVFGEIVE